METLCIAALQMCSRQNRDDNLAQAQALLEESVRKGAQLVALPENFSFLDREGEKLAAVEDLQRGLSIRLLREFAKANNVTIVGGSVPLRAGSKVTNTCLVFDPSGDVIARYDKIHLFDIFLDEAHHFQESRYIAPGSELVTFVAYGQTMGLSICYDLRFRSCFAGWRCAAQVCCLCLLRLLGEPGRIIGRYCFVHGPLKTCVMLSHQHNRASTISDVKASGTR